MARLLLIGLVLLMAVPSLGQEAKTELTPSERFRVVVAKMPTPAEKCAFRFDGEIWVKDESLGRCFYSAEPVRDGEKTLWCVSQFMALNPASPVVRARLGPDLVCLDGEDSWQEKKSLPSVRWVRAEKGYEFVRRDADGRTEKHFVSAPEGALATFASVILFARHAPAEAADYEFPLLSTNIGEDNRCTSMVLSSEGLGKWGGEPALLFRWSKGRGFISFGLHPKSRAVLGLKIGKAGGGVFEVRPREIEAGSAALDEFVPPAKSAKQCALIACLAWGTGDGELFSDVCDWPTIVSGLKARYPDREIDGAELRAEIIRALNDCETGIAREDFIALLKRSCDEVTVQGTGANRATVRFPEAYELPPVRVGRFGEEWRVVSLPAKR
jgi:hypothetical protein